jgi:hypothetical protein
MEDFYALRLEDPGTNSVWEREHQRGRPYNQCFLVCKVHIPCTGRPTHESPRGRPYNQIKYNYSTLGRSCARKKGSAKEPRTISTTRKLNIDGLPYNQIKYPLLLDIGSSLVSADSLPPFLGLE